MHLQCELAKDKNVLFAQAIRLDTSGSLGKMRSFLAGYCNSLLNSCFDKFWMNNEKLTRAGFEPATSRLKYRRSTNWSISPYIGGFPILSISLFGGCQSEVMKPYTGRKKVISPYCLFPGLRAVYGWMTSDCPPPPSLRTKILTK